MSTPGRRLQPTRVGEHGAWFRPEPGGYWKDGENWYAMPPGAPEGSMAGLANHDVVEHADGTITVSPSILAECGDWTWHGYLVRGEWSQI